MNVIIAHVRYRQRGGEEAVVETEAAQLAAHAGVEVTTLTPDSASLDELSPAERLRLAVTLGDYGAGRAAVAEAISAARADVVHFHNLYPLLGPGAVREARTAGCRVVQTLHNYRLSCLAGTHLYRGQVCTRCRPGRFAAGIARGCYRGSRPQSLAMARALSRQWADLCAGRGPHVVLALTPFLRDLYVRHGLPDRLVRVKGNSVPAGRPIPWSEREGVTFAGRLAEEKGVLDLVRAWPAEAPRLRVAGDGPLEAAIRATAGPNVDVLGRVAASRDLRALMRASRAVVVPSLGWEGLPLVLCEAMAEGTPVIAFSGLAGAGLVREVGEELVVDDGDIAGLVRTCVRVCASEDAGLVERAAAVWRRELSPEANLERLLSAYGG